MSDSGPDAPPPTPPPAPLQPVGPPPWSAAAIAGFVCSILGCLGITALAGLVLGIIGLVNTSGGRRRGFGFAVAAIPLSLLSGMGAGFLLLVTLLGRQLVAMPDQLENVFTVAAENPREAATALRAHMSEDFDNAVTDEQLAAWFQQVIATNGTLTKILIDAQGLGVHRNDDGTVTQSLRGRFVNDVANIQITLAPYTGFRQLKIDDIAVNGSSPRDAPPSPP